MKLIKAMKPVLNTLSPLQKFQFPDASRCRFMSFLPYMVTRSWFYLRRLPRSQINWKFNRRPSAKSADKRVRCIFPDDLRFPFMSSMPYMVNPLPQSAIKKLLHRGYIFLPEGEQANVISFTPPLTIAQPQLAQAVAALADVLA